MLCRIFIAAFVVAVSLSRAEGGSGQVEAHDLDDFGSCWREAAAYALALDDYHTALSVSAELAESLKELERRQQESFDMLSLAQQSLAMLNALFGTYEPIIAFRPAASALVFCMAAQRKRELGSR